MITAEQIENFIAQAHRVGDAGLTVCSSGNLSWRIGEEALVSGTGSWVPSLTKEKIAVCRVADGEVLNNFSFGKRSRNPPAGVFRNGDPLFDLRLYARRRCQ